MFNVGDYVIYGANGVCKVIDIGTPKISSIDSHKKYYTLQLIYENGRIFTPIDNNKVAMRKILSREEADDLIRGIPSMDVKWIDDIKEREAKFKTIVNKFECVGFMKLIKAVLLRKKKCREEGKKLSLIDDRYFKRAKECLLCEFSISFDMSKEDVDQYIKNTLKYASN